MAKKRKSLTDQEYEERINTKFCYSIGDIVAITNDDMVCKDCLYTNLKNPSRCSMYAVKPGSVVYGGKCKKFVDEDSEFVDEDSE